VRVGLFATSLSYWCVTGGSILCSGGSRGGDGEKYVVDAACSCSCGAHHNSAPGQSASGAALDAPCLKVFRCLSRRLIFSRYFARPMTATRHTRA